MKRSTLGLLFCVVLWHFNAYGLAVNQADTLNSPATSQISERQFDTNLLREIKADSDFKYEIPPEARRNLLQLIFQKFFEWLLRMVGNEFMAWLIIALIVIVGLVGLGFALYSLFGVGKTVPVYLKEPNGLDYQVKDEDIHEINFSEEIEAAIERKEYRNAIRLLYLFALKLLTDREIIEWAPYKTNHDYVQEIGTEAYRERLSTLGYYFEYAWYGDFQVDSAHLLEMQNAFTDLEGRLKDE